MHPLLCILSLFDILLFRSVYAVVEQETRDTFSAQLDANDAVDADDDSGDDDDDGGRGGYGPIKSYGPIGDSDGANDNVNDSGGGGGSGGGGSGGRSSRMEVDTSSLSSLHVDIPLTPAAAKLRLNSNTDAAAHMRGGDRGVNPLSFLQPSPRNGNGNGNGDGAPALFVNLSTHGSPFASPSQRTRRIDSVAAKQAYVRRQEAYLAELRVRSCGFTRLF
jgi:hypothetical protein